MTARKSTTDKNERDGFLYDPDEAVRHLSSADPTLAGLMERAGPVDMRIRRMQNPFEALAGNIIYQQLHGNAAAGIHSRAVPPFGQQKLDPEALLDSPQGCLR